MGVTSPCASQKPERQPTKGPMKKISDLFTDEEKKQLSYLGSMLSRPNTPFEEEVQRIIDADLTRKEKQVEEDNTSNGTECTAHIYGIRKLEIVSFENQNGSCTPSFPDAELRKLLLARSSDPSHPQIVRSIDEVSDRKLATHTG